MIDIHSHIIPGVDDGSKSIEESMDMLKCAYDQGIRVVCATPHLTDTMLDESLDTLYDSYIEKLDFLKGKCVEAGMDLKIILGCEVRFQTQIKELSQYPFSTFNNNGKYMLIEFPMADVPPNSDNVIFEIGISGIIPIIAHPERNLKILERPHIMAGMVKYGALTQINAGSVLGIFGKPEYKMSLNLLQKGLVHLVASDAHNNRRRNFVLRKAYFKLIDIVGKQKAKELIFINPRKVILGESIEARVEESVVEESRGFMSKFLGRIR
ncbi:MAG: tyrosine-protein phosphatase, partial [Fidelibacterota bacterium]